MSKTPSVRSCCSYDSTGLLPGPPWYWQCRLRSTDALADLYVQATTVEAQSSALYLYDVPTASCYYVDFLTKTQTPGVVATNWFPLDDDVVSGTCDAPAGPSVHVVEPNGGESYQMSDGFTAVVAWTGLPAADVGGSQDILLSLSEDGGTTWTSLSLFTPTASSGSYSYYTGSLNASPYVESATCLLRATLPSSLGSDQSDAEWTLTRTTPGCAYSVDLTGLDPNVGGTARVYYGPAATVGLGDADVVTFHGSSDDVTGFIPAGTVVGVTQTAGSAAFRLVTTDTTTGPSWYGTYGSSGWSILDGESHPAWVSADLYYDTPGFTVADGAGNGLLDGPPGTGITRTGTGLGTTSSPVSVKVAVNSPGLVTLGVNTNYGTTEDFPLTVTRFSDSSVLWSGTWHVPANTPSYIQFEITETVTFSAFENTTTGHPAELQVVLFDEVGPNGYRFSLPSQYLLFVPTTGSWQSVDIQTLTDGTSSYVLPHDGSAHDPKVGVADRLDVHGFNAFQWGEPVPVSAMWEVDREIQWIPFVIPSGTGTLNVTSISCSYAPVLGILQPINDGNGQSFSALDDFVVEFTWDDLPVGTHVSFVMTSVTDSSTWAMLSPYAVPTASGTHTLTTSATPYGAMSWGSGHSYTVTISAPGVAAVTSPQFVLTNSGTPLIVGSVVGPIGGAQIGSVAITWSGGDGSVARVYFSFDGGATYSDVTATGGPYEDTLDLTDVIPSFGDYPSCYFMVIDGSGATGVSTEFEVNTNP